MKKVYIILTVVVAAIIVVITILLRMYSKENPNTRNLKPDVTADVAKITADFKADTSKARKTYNNKVIEFNGPVDKTEHDRFGHTFVYFTANDINLQCLIQKDDSAAAAAIKPKDNLKLRGKYDGMIQDEIDPQPMLKFRDCIIVKPEEK